MRVPVSRRVRKHVKRRRTIVGAKQQRQKSRRRWTLAPGISSKGLLERRDRSRRGRADAARRARVILLLADGDSYAG